MRRFCRWFALSVALLHLPALAAAQSGAEPPRASQPPASNPATPSAPPGEASSPNAGTSPERLAPGSNALASGGGASQAEQRIEELERRLRALEEKRTDVTEETTSKNRDNGRAGGVAYGPDGMGLVSPDGKFQFRFRPVLQTDARFFINAGTNTFLLRRVRPALEGTAFEYFDWRIMPEFAGTPIVQDAFIDIRLFKEIQLRSGKFKPPLGLERLVGDRDLAFLERGLPTNLVPDRDLGLQLHGDILGETIVYAAGIFNGAGDGVNGDVDNNDKKDIDGRIMVRPFQPTFIELLRKLGLGIAASRGSHSGQLPTYKTPVSTTFFQYADNVTAGGTHRRLAPQAFFYFGPAGVFAEYTKSTQIVTAPGISSRLDNDSWQVVGSFFVTGEDAWIGTVAPKHPLDPRRLGFGAVELVARYGELRVDRDAFALKLADPAKSAHKAADWGVGVNWHLARNYKFMIDYEHTSFKGGAPNGGDKQSEILILSRLQAAY